MPQMPELKTYDDAESWLLSITDYERLLGKENIVYNTRTFDLDRFRDQLRTLGDPQKKFAVVHVAGTKGKGSTCAFLESALRNCGYRTGLYTSPHIYRFTERIQVNGACVDEGTFCKLLMRTAGQLMYETQDEVESQRSFRTVFEILTASALRHFADEQVDVAIFETGLGGRLDSTNVFDEPGAGPLVNVITAIGLDHTSILGDTVEAIAGEKAGILRSHGRIVLGPQVDNDYQTTVTKVVKNRHQAISTANPIRSVAEDMTVGPSEASSGMFQFKCTRFCGEELLGSALEKGINLRPSLEGPHQLNNTATALMALMEFEGALQSQCWPKSPSGGQWPQLKPDKVVEGLEHTTWPGRFSVLEAGVPVVVDGAHCTISAAAMAATCKAHFGEKPAVIVTGFLKDKAGDDMLQAIAQQVPVTGAIALPPPSPRAQVSDHIVEALSRVFGSQRVQSADTMQIALEKAVDVAAAVEGYVIVFGSLYLVGPALDAVKQISAAANR